MKLNLRVKNQSVFYALLMPAPWFCDDFFEPWFLWAATLALAARIIRPLPAWLLLPAAGIVTYLNFQEYAQALVPESSVAFLNTMVLVKICDKTSRFHSNIIWSMLWVGSFALFNNTIYYLAYMALYFFMAVNLLKRQPQKPFELSGAQWDFRPAWNMLKVLPLIAALFFFFPRFRGFLPAATGAAQTGKVGYSKTIDNTNAGDLSLSSQTAFYSDMEPLPSELLYWRGRVHVQTDGYNWRPQRLPAERTLPVASEAPSIRYEIRYAQDLEGDLVLLDLPLRIEENKIGSYHLQSSNTYRSYQKDRKTSLVAVSTPTGSLRDPLSRNRDRYLQLPSFLPKSFLAMNERVEGSSPAQIIDSFAGYLRAEGFSYTLAPGQMPDMNSFLEAKQGFCTHYAALLGALLRHRDVPARLVSGFQGGEYNESGGFYTVRSSDAHAWVEYHDGQAWRRVDPTSFVSPQRIQRGGEFLFESTQTSAWRSAFNMRFVRALSQQLSNLNYKITVFLEDYDREAQKALAQKLRLGLKGFYILGALLGFASIALALFLVRRRRKTEQAPEDLEFAKFAKLLAKKGVEIDSAMSERKLEILCQELGLPQAWADFVNVYRHIKYHNQTSLLPQLRQLRAQLDVRS